MSHIQEIELPDGTVVFARLSAPDVYGADDQDVGVMDVAAAKVEQLGELITAVGSTVLDAARAVRPDEATITFGVEFTAKSGKAFAVLAEGEAKASVQVGLTWRYDQQTTGTTPPAATAHQAPLPPDTPAAPSTAAFTGPDPAADAAASTPPGGPATAAPPGSTAAPPGSASAHE